MSMEHLLPVGEMVVAHRALQSELSLGRKIKVHTKKEGLPELDGIEVVLLGVPDGRGAVDNIGTGNDLDTVRKCLYQMFPGNWFSSMADLGDIPRGHDLNDTYALIKEIVAELLSIDIVPILLGGGQDLTYANYRAYDLFNKPVNLVSIDHKFDIAELDPKINAYNYLHAIVMDQPTNLFNFSNLGYQTFYNSQEEIDLMDRLHFEAYRVGEIAADITSAEPVLRDADIVSVDMSAVRMSDAPGNNNAGPNGFYGDQICALSRYAGISRKVSSFGIYEYNAKYDQRDQTANLVAQMIWYFMEGFNLRIDEYPYESLKNYKKYMVMVDEKTINFFKSNKSQRWWMEVNYSHNKTNKSTLIPCTYSDYVTASNQIIPERWLKTFRKLN